MGVLAAGPDASHFESASAAIEAMAGTQAGVPDREPLLAKPDQSAHDAYRQVYKKYRKLSHFLNQEIEDEPNHYNYRLGNVFLCDGNRHLGLSG